MGENGERLFVDPLGRGYVLKFTCGNCYSICEHAIKKKNQNTELYALKE